GPGLTRLAHGPNRSGLDLGRLMRIDKSFQGRAGNRSLGLGKQADGRQSIADRLRRIGSKGSRASEEPIKILAQRRLVLRQAGNSEMLVRWVGSAVQTVTEPGQCGHLPADVRRVSWLRNSLQNRRQLRIRHGSGYDVPEIRHERRKTRHGWSDGKSRR